VAGITEAQAVQRLLVDVDAHALGPQPLATP
jgi:hypothetical protein